MEFFHFSSTGNSLQVAEILLKRFSGAGVIPIMRALLADL
jgi:hypothetical protein